MTVQRSWTAESFRRTIVEHPLLSRLARRLVWDCDGTGARLDALGDLVDPNGSLVQTPDRIRVAHPAALDLTPWETWLNSSGITQPFSQIRRDVYTDQDPSTLWNATVSAASLFGLIRRGWQWGPSGQGARRVSISRQFGTDGEVWILIEPGTIAGVNGGDPDQTIEEIALRSPRHGDFGVFTDLNTSTRSELIRDLMSLERRDPPAGDAGSDGRREFSAEN